MHTVHPTQTQESPFISLPSSISNQSTNPPDSPPKKSLMPTFTATTWVQPDKHLLLPGFYSGLVDGLPASCLSLSDPSSTLKPERPLRNHNFGHALTSLKTFHDLSIILKLLHKSISMTFEDLHYHIYVHPSSFHIPLLWHSLDIMNYFLTLQ